MENKIVIQVAILIGIFLLVIPDSVQAQKTIAVSTSGGYALALMDDGAVYAWGSSKYGFSGDVPQKLPIDNVTAVSAGSMVSLALRSDGTVWAWGDNYYGGLGDGTFNSSSTPVKVKGLEGVVAIAVGDGTCYALKSDGTVWAWGRNDMGQVGDGTLESRPEPVQAKGLTGIVALGEHGNYAIKNDGTVWAWGSNDIGEGSYGALGDDSGPGARPVPFQVKGASNATQISNGGYYAIYVKDDGTAWGWGEYDLGQLGDGSTHSSRPPPVKPPSTKAQISNVEKVSCGGAFTIALKDDGTVWQWGRLIGDSEPIPFMVKGLDHVVDINAGGSVCFAVRDDGTVWGWGADYMDCGVLGNKNRVVAPGPDGAISYVIVRDPVVILGVAKPTFSEPSVGISVTPIKNSTGHGEVPGVSAPDMIFNGMIFAGLAVMVTCIMSRWQKYDGIWLNHKR